jgi:hypothetical protein
MLKGLSIVVGVTSLFGVVSLCVYLYFLLQYRRVEQSVRGLIHGDALFHASQVLQILAQFHDDDKRLEAIKELTHYDTATAKDLLTKVQGGVVLSHLNQATYSYYRQLSGRSSLLFIVLASIALAFAIISPDHGTISQAPPVLTQSSRPPDIVDSTRSRAVTNPLRRPADFTASRYHVNLLIPTSMSNATILLDGRDAIIADRTATVVKIDIPAAPPRNHVIRLDQDGVVCTMTVAIMHDQTLSPCEN